MSASVGPPIFICKLQQIVMISLGSENLSCYSHLSVASEFNCSQPIKKKRFLVSAVGLLQKFHKPVGSIQNDQKGDLKFEDPQSVIKGAPMNI